MYQHFLSISLMFILIFFPFLVMHTNMCNIHAHTEDKYRKCLLFFVKISDKEKLIYGLKTK